MKYPYRFKLLFSLLFLFSGATALAQTSKNVIVRTGQGRAASFVGDAHNEARKQMLEKHKEAVESRRGYKEYDYGARGGDLRVR